MRLTSRGRWAAWTAAALMVGGLVMASSAASAAGLFLAILLALAVASLARPRLIARREIPRWRFTEGEAFVERIEIEITSGGVVQAEIVEWADPGLRSEDGQRKSVTLARGRNTVHEIHWRAVAWGPQRLGPLSIVFRDAFGLIETEVGPLDAEALRVLPAPQQLGKFAPKGGNPEPALGAHTVTKPGDAMEFFALRDYAPGDSIRRINWKASARSQGKTIVNQMARDSFARVTVLIDLRAKETIGEYEATSRTRNGRAAASIIAHHDRMKDHLTVVTVTSEATKLSMNANPRMPDLLDALAACAPGGDLELDEALRQHLGIIRPRSPFYLITSAAFDDRIEEAIRLVLALRGRPILISPVPAGSGDEMVDQLAAASHVEGIRRANAMGARVVDWAPGASLEVSLLAS